MFRTGERFHHVEADLTVWRDGVWQVITLLVSTSCLRHRDEPCVPAATPHGERGGRGLPSVSFPRIATTLFEVQMEAHRPPLHPAVQLETSV